MSNSKSPTDIPTAPPALSIVATIKLGIIAITLVVMAVVAGHVGPFSPKQKVDAQASSGGKARCEQLYTAWSHSNANDGSNGGGANVRATMAMADCERGDFAGGNAELERLLRHNGMHVPQAQTAAAR